MKRTLYLWHRRLALLVFIPLQVWALSGLLHPLMRITRAEPAQMFYPAPTWTSQTDQLSVQSILSTAGLSEVSNIRPIKVGDTWLLQVIAVDNQPATLFNASGETVENGAQRYAEQLARHYSDDSDSPVKSIRFVDKFSAEYPAVNRLLPVWQVSFERNDQLSVFVDIRQDRLGALSNNTQHTLMGLFQLTHLWSFLPAEHPARNALFILLMAGAAFVGISGLYLYIWLPRHKQPSWNLRKLHSYSGLAVSLLLVMFVISGLIRTVEKMRPDPRGRKTVETFQAEQLWIEISQLRLKYPQANGMNLHILAGQPHAQLLQPRSQPLWINLQTGQAIKNGENRYAGQLARQLTASPSPIVKQAHIHHFKDHPDYGFIDKRLPVNAVEMEKQLLFIDTRSGVVASQVDNSGRLMRWSFRHLHKWRFADGLGKDARDVLITLTILAISASSLMGGWLWLRRRTKQRTALRPRAQQPM